MKCPSCGSENKKTAKFCNNCASPLQAAAPPAATPPAAPPPAEQPAAAAPAQPAAAAAPPAPPPPGPLPAAAVPTPRGPVPAGVWAGVGIGGIILVGILVWFFVLRPDPKQAVQPESSPIVETTPPPPSPTDTASPLPTTAPSPTTSPSPTTGGSVPTSYGTNVCGSVDAEYTCVDPFEFTATGWTVPVDTANFHFYFQVDNPEEGAVISFDYIDKATGQSAGTSTWDPLVGVEAGTYVFYDTWTLNEGEQWAAGTAYSIVVKYNGQALNFGAPNDITFQ